MTIVSGVRHSGAIVSGRREGGGVDPVDPYSLFSDNFDSGPNDPLDRGWSYFLPAVLATAGVSGGMLRHYPTAGGTGGSFWFDARLGYLIYKTIGGVQLEARARVQPTDTAGEALPPLGSGSTYRLFGLAAHNPDRTTTLNYVHVAAGVAAGAYAFESKSTLNSVSTFPVVGLAPTFPWTLDLRIVRDGANFETFYRNMPGPLVALNSDDGWISHTVFSRPDLPTELQWGLMAYASTITAAIGGFVQAVEFASL